MFNIKVQIETPSRLHFGIIDMRGDIGRIHCSVGVAIDYPKIILHAQKSLKIEVKGSRSDRVIEFAKQILDKYKITTGISVEILSDIPEHKGFGSGTQLALAVGTAISKLYNLDLKVDEIALLLSRSRVSGVGTQAFKLGGFIIDGGHRVDKLESVAPLIFRYPVPDNWFFIIGVPDVKLNISGETEKRAFTIFEPPPVSIIGEVARVVLIKMMPAIIEGDIKSFGESMTSLDFGFGDYWIKVQGGRFGHPIIESGIKFLLKNGAHGVGQSSWGPAFYGLVLGEKLALDLTKKLNKFLNEDGRSGETFYTKANNEGARIKVIN